MQTDRDDNPDTWWETCPECGGKLDPAWACRECGFDATRTQSPSSAPPRTDAAQDVERG